MKYVPAFEKVISAKKTALWFQIDRRIDLLINLQLSATIPVVNPEVSGLESSLPRQRIAGCAAFLFSGHRVSLQGKQPAACHQQ